MVINTSYDRLKHLLALTLFCLVVLGPAAALLPYARSPSAAASCMLLLLLGYATWAMLVHRAIPLAWHSVKRALRWHQNTTARYLFVTFAISGFLVYPFLRTTQIAWFHPKWFDDTMAISNAQKYINQGLDPDTLYFRSFLRPTFVGLCLPFAIVDPLPEVVITKSPSDKYRRVWHIHYDGYIHGGRWNGTVAPFHSAALLGLALLLPFLSFGVLSCLGIRPWSALLGSCLLLDWHIRSIEEIVTQTHNMALVVLMAATSIHWMRRGGTTQAACTGAALASGYLAIHSMAVALIPLLWLIVQRSHQRGMRLLHSTPLLAGGLGFLIPILIWYEGYLRGLFFEFHFFNIEQWETLFLMNYAQLSPAVAWGHFRIILGPSLYPALLSLALVPFLVWRNRRWGLGVTLWLLTSTAAIVSQDYVFNRFFLCGLLPTAWALGRTLDWITLRR
jgi:hypothetical protein